jgi:hypothetical protein
MSNKAFAESARAWLMDACSKLGLNERDTRQSMEDHVLMLGDVAILFSEVMTGKDSDVLVRALIGEVPPAGECEPFYELVLRTQLLLCGPFTPVLGLDTTSRNLLVSHCVDTAELTAEDGTQVLQAMREMALHWRGAMAHLKAEAVS